MKESTLRATHRLAWATSLCVLLTAASNVGWSQQTDGLIPSSAEPGRALSEGIRLYRRGDFEKASDAFSKAQVTADRLSDKDQSVLNEYIDRSSRALVARHQGRMELGEAEEALSAGDAEKASELLVRAASNRFLTPDDLSHVQELETQLKSMKPKKESFWGSRFRLFSRRETSSPPEVSASQAMAEAVQIPTSPITQVAATETRPTSPTDANPLPAAAGDAKQLLREARMFMRSGLVDQAERFALAASEAKVRWDPTGDSPERILNEIQEFRAKYPAPQAVAAAIPAPTTESATPDKASALALLAEGRKRLANGELESAKEMAVRVYAMNVGLTPADGDTPEQLYSDYKRAAARKPEPDVSEKPTKADSAPSPTDQSTATPTPSAERFDPSVQVVEFETPAQTNKLDKYRPTTDRKVEAMQIMAQAQSAMNRGDHATAIQLAKKVEEMGVSFADHEPSPRRIYQAHQAIRERIEQRKQQQAVAHEEMLGRHLEMQRQRSLVSATEPEAAVESPTDNAPPKPFPASPTDDVVESAPTKSLPTIEKWSAEKPASNIEWSTDVQNVASTRPNVKPVAATVELEELAVAAGHLQDDQAESAIRQTAGPGKSAALLDAGINAMGRRDFDRAMSFFEEASRNIDSLTESQKQRLQDLTAECLTKISRDGKSRPGRRSISDDTSFAGLQEADQPGVVRDVPLSEPNRDEIAQAKERESILLQKLRQDVIEAIEQASLQLRSNPDRAIESLRTALDSVKASGLNPDQVASLVSRLESQIRQYQRARQEFVITQIEEDQQSAARDARQRTIQAELQKQNTIKQLSNRFNALMEEGSYKEAEAVAYQITEIDPDEPFGVAAMYKAQLSRRYAEIEDLEWRKQKGWWDTLQSVDESAVPIPDDQEILFPDARTWEELTKRREKYKSATLEEKSETTQRIEKSLTRPITFDFRDNPLSQVIEFIKDFTGVNVVLDLNGLEIAGVDPDEPVTLVLDNIPLKSALKLLLDPLDLTYLIKNDVLLITDKTETGTELQTLVYPVADLVIPIQNFAGGGGAGGAGGGGGFGGAGGLGGGGGGFGGGGGGLGGGGFGGGGGGFGGGGGGFGGGGGGFGGGGGGFGGGGGGQGGGQGGDISQQVIELIRTVVKAPEEWSEDGGLAEIEYFQPNRTFIVTASQATHEMLEDLLSQLRRLQDLQVSVEVRFITVSDAFFERIGIDFDVSIDNNNDEYIIQEAAGQTSPVGVPQVDNNGLGVFDGNHVRGVTVGRDPTGTRTSNFNIPIAQSSFAAATVPALAGLGATNLGGTNFGIAFLNDIDVFLLLEAVQGDQRSNTLQAPKVMLFNGQIATVEVQDLVPFVTDVTPVISAGAVTFDPTVTQIANGTQLTVQAVVSADRRFVRLTIIPQLQTVEAINDVRTVNVQGTAGGGGSVGGGISVANTAQATIQLPTVSVVRVLTTVTVPDGGTVLLGGLKSHREARNEYGTPVLSKIPYLNRLFKNASTARVTDSLMLLVSPRIIILEEEEEDLGAQTQTYGIR